MMNKLIIGSLSRSGSAWLTTALNACTCLRASHELLSKIHRGEQSWENWDVSIGSDATVPDHRHIPEGAKTMFLWRKPDDCMASLMKMGVFDYNHWVSQRAWAANYIELYKPIFLPYDALGTAVGMVAEAMCVEYDKAILKELLDMRIVSRNYKDSQ